MAIKLKNANAGKPLTIEDYNENNTIIETAINDLESQSVSDGTLTDITDDTTDVAELFETTISNPTTTPNITYSRVSKSANLVYASPNGSSGKPTFRSIATADLPTIPHTKGGTGITSLSPNKVVKTNASSNGYVLSEIKGGSTKISVTVVGNDLELDLVAANVPIDGLDGSTPLSIAKGGSGQSTAQNAINALTQVSSAAAEYVLTKDTASGNATYKPIPNIVTAKIGNNQVTYAKVQQVSALKLLGNATSSTANVAELGISANLLLDSSKLTDRSSVFDLASSNTTMTVANGKLYVDATSEAITITLPDTSTLQGGEIFTVKRINSGAYNVTLRCFDTGTDVIDGATEEALIKQYDAITFQYAGTIGGKNTFYIINLVS